MLFLTARAVSGVRSSLNIRKENRYAPILRWVGLGVAGALAVLAVLSFFLPSDNVLIWGGIYAAIAAVVVAVMQSNLTIVNRLLGFLLEVFYWRCIIFIVLSITCYFHTVLIVGGILLDLLAVAYFVIACVFKEREYYDAATIAQEEQKAKARAQMEENTRTPPTV